MTSQITPRILFIATDWETSVVTLVRSDMKKAQFRLATPSFPRAAIANSTYFPDFNFLHIQTKRGESIGVEMATRADPAPTDRRPVVYLDQKDWSFLVKVTYAPGKVPEAQRAPALEVIALAEQRKIILPMSAAHMLETGKWKSAHARYRLAVTLARLSWGWQMCNPLQVRRKEVRNSFAKTFGHPQTPAPRVFTLEPNVIFGSGESTYFGDRAVDLSPDRAFAIEALTSICARIDTLLNDEHVESIPAEAWAAHNQQFTDWLATDRRQQTQKRQSIDCLFVADIQQELAEEALASGITPSQMSEWFRNHRNTEVAAMPSLGLFREVLTGKHLDGGTVWRSTDLIDLAYLACAVGYADYVVGERSAISQLEQAQRRLQRPVNVFRHLSDLVSELKKAGISPDAI